MKRGNCLIGAIALMIRHRTVKVSVLRTIRPVSHRPSWVPHFIVRDKGGNLWHYKRVRDVLPYPLSFFYYHGQYCIYKTAWEVLYDELWPEPPANRCYMTFEQMIENELHHYHDAKPKKI